MKWAAEEISPSQIVLPRVVFGFLPIFSFRSGEAGAALGTHRRTIANIEEPKTAQTILSDPKSTIA